MASSSTARDLRLLAPCAAGALVVLVVLSASPRTLAQSTTQPAKPTTPTTPAIPVPKPTNQAGTADSVELAPSGKSLIIPEAIKAKGTAYHAQPGGPRQISFLSDAPFEKISGHSNGVVGFAIAGPDNEPAHLQAGEWHVPINSLHTGSNVRDTQLVKAEWFNAAKFPHIVFRLKDVQNIKPIAGMRDPALRAYTATIVGDLTMHGVTRELSISDATIRFRPKGPKGAASTDGDSLLIGWKTSIKLSDFGVTHSQITSSKQVSNTIEIDAQFVLSTVAPEDQPQHQEAPTGRPGNDARSNDAAPPSDKRK